jgi:hypothetical protein
VLGGERDAGSGSGRPPVEAALREAFGAKPKALPIISQEFERGAGAVAKDVDGAAQRIFAQGLAAQRGQPIYPLPKAHGLYGENHTTLGRELEHQRTSRKVWSRGTSRGAASL